jgi:Tol biopolymer transport system component
VKSTTTFSRKILREAAFRATIYVCIVSGAGGLTRTSVTDIVAWTAVVDVAAQSQGESAMSANPKRLNVERTPALELRIVFYGYPEIGRSQSGAAVINDTGLSDIHEITFTRMGGELSPDGRAIAYDNCSSRNRGIYLAEPDGRNARRIIPLRVGYCVDVRWSPDSKKLSYPAQADRVLHVFDLATSRERLIPGVQGVDWHWWSPTGDQIVYAKIGSASAGRLLHITDLHGNKRQLTFTKDFVPCAGDRNLVDTSAPAWSPKGDKIAFTQCSGLFVISPNGENLRQLTSAERAPSPTILPFTSAYNPRWAPDGRWIFFSEGYVFVGTRVVLKRISPDGVTLVEIGKLPYGGGSFSIAPLIKRL